MKVVSHSASIICFCHPSLTSTQDFCFFSSNTHLQDDDEDFPRGGSNTLTPLEVRRVKDEAEKDILFAVKNIFALSISVAYLRGHAAIGTSNTLLKC